MKTINKTCESCRYYNPSENLSKSGKAMGNCTNQTNINNMIMLLGIHTAPTYANDKCRHYKKSEDQINKELGY